MKMLKRSILPIQGILLLLMLLSSTSSYSFSAYPVFNTGEVLEDHQDILANAAVDKQVDLFDSILPVQKDILFNKGNFAPVGDFRDYILYHTCSSESYIKCSRYIFPSLGVRELIFPFHVFL